MIGLDTNVIIRYLTQDDEGQSKKANQIIENGINSNHNFWISQLTFCEVVWVLERSYKLKKTKIIDILSKILETEHLIIENESIVEQALEDYKQHSISFSDCLIGQFNKHHDCLFTYTFDVKAANKLSTFKLVN
jgi:predicted nucleic-acid-binding protein